MMDVEFAKTDCALKCRRIDAYGIVDTFCFRTVAMTEDFYRQSWWGMGTGETMA